MLMFVNIYGAGCNLSDFLRQTVDNDEGHNISNIIFNIYL